MYGRQVCSRGVDTPTARIKVPYPGHPRSSSTPPAPEAMPQAPEQVLKHRFIRLFSAHPARQVTVNPAGPGNRAFNSLARYIFGDNAARSKMAMTTPVFSDTAGSMAFVIGGSAQQASGARATV